MKKRKIFLYHFLVFVAGAVALATYFTYKISHLPSEAAPAVIALVPIALIYVIGFGILCLISLSLWLLVAYLKNRST